MDSNEINETWYRRLADKYGFEAAIAAGYFQESKPWTLTYSEVFGADYFVAPEGICNVIQFSGAFFPFHEGHRDALQAAISYLAEPVLIFVHVDHKEYRHSKGRFDESQFEKSLELLKTLELKRDVQTKLVFEDKMSGGCSRNFTRLYQEIVSANSSRNSVRDTSSNPICRVWFLAGGDRVSFCRAFVDEGRCLIVGRNTGLSDPAILKLQNERIVFLPGHNAASSTAIRKRNG
jgi:nicotinic acid mononucleotide adenylyltransferase